MFIEKGMKIRAITKQVLSFTGTIMDLAIQPCKDDQNRPHALLIIKQDYNYVAIEGEFEHVTLWVENLEQIEVYNKEEPIPHNAKILPIREFLLQELRKIITLDANNDITFYILGVFSDTDYPDIINISGEIDVFINNKESVCNYAFCIRKAETDPNLSHAECTITFCGKFTLER